MNTCTTPEEVNRLYSDHLASLRMWGGEFNEAEVLLCWDAALQEVGG